MAVAFESFANISVTLNQTSITIAKPTGLAAGDLMVAFLAILDAASTIDVTSGWTDSGVGELNGSSLGTTFRGRVLYKVADSSDAAASNFTFTLTGGNTDFVGGSIHRISGQNANQPIDVKVGFFTTDSATPSLATGLTPSYANELYLFCTAWTGGTGISSQAIATDNPTWTEDFDTVSTLGLAVAHATRSATTALGNASFTIDGGTGNSDSIFFMIVVRDIVSVTVSPSVLNSTGTLLAPTITGGATVSPSVINATGAVLTPIHNDQADWSAQDKSDTATWTNQSKS